MKRRLFPLLILVLTVVCLVGLASCNGNAYKIEFYDGDTLLYTYLVNKGGSFDDIPDVPTKEGYVGQWSIEDFEEVDKNLKVFAVYTKAQYAVSFYVDGDLLTTRYANRNSRITNVPAVPEKSGYTGEWSVTDFSLIDRDIDVHAVYTATDVKVTFLAGEQIVAVSDVTDGVTEYVPEIPAVVGRSYSAKWVLGSADGTETPDFSHVEESLTVYAHYFVTLTLVGGERESVSAEIDGEISLPAYGRKTGYDFLGWYTDNTFATAVDFPRGFEENTTLYARWISNASDEGFLFDEGAIIGYEGTSTTPVAPYKYVDLGGQEVLVTKVAPYAFEESDLTKITLPSTITEIGDSAFYGSYFLTEVLFPDGSFVERIGEEAFCDCRNLTGFTFSIFTQEIGEAAFYNCRAATDYVDLERSAVAILPADTFYANAAVTSFRLPASLKQIGDYCFMSVTGAEFSFAGSAVESVGRGAFSGCERLRVFEQPSLTSIGDGAFIGCRSLSSLTVTSDKPVYTLFGDSTGEHYYNFTAPGGSRNYGIPIVLRSVYVCANPRTPAVVAGTLVTNAFYGTSSVKTITIGSGVKVIEDKAFALSTEADDSVELSVLLPSGLLSIGKEAFSGRVDLTSISLPLSLTSIGEKAFYGLRNLSSVALPDNNALVTVEKYAFNGTAWYNGFTGVVRLGRVALGVSGNSIKYELYAEEFAGTDTVAPMAFAGNTRLTKIVLADSILHIGDGAFSDTALVEIVLNAACEVGEDVLAGSSAVRRLTLGASKTVQELFGQTEYAGSIAYAKDAETYYLPAGLDVLTIVADEKTSVDADVFVGLSTVTRIVLAEGISSVADGAFCDNVALTSISLPSSLLTLGTGYEGEEDLSSLSASDVLAEKTGVFNGSANLTQVTFASSATLTHILGKTFFGTAITSLALPSSLSYIGAYAFADTALESLTFAASESLSIGDYAFAWTTLAPDTFSHFALTLPEGTTDVGAYAFYGRTGITSVSFNDGLTYIGDGAFMNCSVSKVALPESVRFTEEESPVGTFKNDPVVEISLRHDYSMDVLFGGIPAILTVVKVTGGVIRNGQFAGLTALQNVELKQIESIGDEAFRGCTGLTGVEIPTTVVSIGEYAFAECTALRACVFAHGSLLTTLGDYAFYGDVRLAETVLPDTLTEDNDLKDVFAGCVKLQSVNIPKDLLSIGERAFYQCAEITSIAIPEGVVNVGKEAFFGCAKMEFENVRFDALVGIGDSAFAGCELLHAVKAENISSIGEGAFFGCVDLKEITIVDHAVSEIFETPGSIVNVNVSAAAESIPAAAFDGCVNLTSITVYTDEEGINAMLTGMASLNRYGAKVFITAEAYQAVSEENRAAFAGALYTSPSVLDATYLYDEEMQTATLLSVNEFTEAVLYLPSHVEKGDVRYEVVAIGDSVFKDNENVREVIVPYTIRRIGNYVFEGCENLALLRFEIGSRLTYIGKKAFYMTTGLTFVDLPDPLTEIDDQAFAYSGLQTIGNTVYSRLQIVGEYAFYRTESLQNVVFNGIIADIGEHAFEYSGIADVTFGARATITELKAHVFAECYNLSEETIAYLQENYVADETAFARRP